jgi:hypothetical protein
MEGPALTQQWVEAGLLLYSKDPPQIGGSWIPKSINYFSAEA